MHSPRQIQLLLLDVDGVLTDGGLYVDDNGLQSKRFHVGDGLAIGDGAVRLRLVSIDGSPPDLLDPPFGCPYAPRCALAVDQCLDAMPTLEVHIGREGGERRVACWRAFDVALT